MRNLSYFVVTQTEEDYPSVVQSSFSKGMVYPAPHVYIFKVNPADEDYTYVRMRPIHERCGTVRDSRLNNNGIGILIQNKNRGNLDEKVKKLISNIIKNFIDDFGIIQYQIVTDEVNDDTFVDTLDLPLLISIAPSAFNKRI